MTEMPLVADDTDLFKQLHHYITSTKHQVMWTLKKVWYKKQALSLFTYNLFYEKHR
jgi:hypothetical protein